MKKIYLSLSLHRHPVGSAKAEGEQLGLPNGSRKNMPAITFITSCFSVVVILQNG